MKSKLTALLLWAPGLCMANPIFTGVWDVDFRDPAQIAAGVECGGASFTLAQTDTAITGSHFYATMNCGRLDEDGAVEGVVVGDEATLFVTSGRNGAVVKGTARLLQSGQLQWKYLELVKSGDPQGDELILRDSVLKRRAKKPS